ncbi:hypothetical protein MNBD_GAMMA01-1721 [hydrothermal vent metagenome]|uniref:Lipoprotein n=1 Tax=hydrothermal vent metagenome TaxID=652676 RepID=A0A3B0VAB6_9ZZZZ
MPAVNLITVFVAIIILVLSSCAKREFYVSGTKFSQSGLVTHSLAINVKKQQQLLVCFSEIHNSDIQGFSCQNDTGFHLFSGGKTTTNKFKFEKVSRLLFKIKPQTIFNYIKISLLEDYHITDTTIKVDKSNNITNIIDHKNKLSVIVTQL